MTDLEQRAELLPCPFCGKAPQVCPDNSYGEAMVFCPDEHDCLVGPVADVAWRDGDALTKAITAWNTRAALQPNAAMVEAERVSAADALILGHARMRCALEQIEAKGANPGIGVTRDIARSALSAIPQGATIEESSMVQPESLTTGERDYRAYCENDPDHKADGTVESLAICATMLETYGPECFPANEHGQIHFARSMMDSTAAEIRAFLARSPVEPARIEREAVARKLCEQHGGDPDAVASEPDDCWEGPLWTVFLPDADAILALLRPASEEEA